MSWCIGMHRLSPGHTHILTRWRLRLTGKAEAPPMKDKTMRELKVPHGLLEWLSRTSGCSGQLTGNQFYHQISIRCLWFFPSIKSIDGAVTADL